MRHTSIGSIVVIAALAVGGFTARPVAAPQGMVVAGTIGPAETDLTPDQEQHLLGEYWTVAKKYLGADPSIAVKEIAAWTLDRVGKVQSIQYQPEKGQSLTLENKAEWNPRMLRAAGMLHTDVAIEALKQHKEMVLEYHLGLADGWFALADNRKSEPGSLRSQWNVAVGRLLLTWGELAMAERILAKMDQRIPNDPQLMLIYGTSRETQATRVFVPASSGKVDEPQFTSGPRDQALESAATIFQRVIAADPKLTEAKVRLAHVYILRKNDAQAEKLLAEVLAGQPPAALKYLSDMMLGGIRERQGQLNPAAQLYADAFRASPGGQSAYLAIAHIYQQAGQPNEAATVLERLFNLRIDNAAADPWWTYQMGLDANIDARFNELRAEVRK
jgi:tetratricopeptide (TPR) repeat protein